MIPRLARTLAGLVATITVGHAFAQVTLYEAPNFGGRAIRADHSVSDLQPTGFNDRARSAVVRDGNWQLCSDAFFRGSCVTLGPGEYPSLGAMRLQDAVSSVRELGWTPDRRGGWDRDGGSRGGDDARGPEIRGYVDPGDGDRDRGRRPGWGAGGRAILFEGRGLTGRAMAVDPAGMPNLDPTGFNDRAGSLRVEAGYWLFCSDANFRGECRTFAPGDYAELPRGLDGRISSGRRVSNDYPYRQPPQWDR